MMNVRRRPRISECLSDAVFVQWVSQRYWSSSRPGFRAIRGSINSALRAMSAITPPLPWTPESVAVPRSLMSVFVAFPGQASPLLDEAVCIGEAGSGKSDPV
jgi:hypothetical protein